MEPTPKYVNVDELIAHMADVPYKGSVRRILLQAPAAPVAPIKKGSWEPFGCTVRCSNCHEPRDHATWLYCPICGFYNS